MIELPILKELPNGLKIALLPVKNVESVTIHLKGLAGSNYEKTDEATIYAPTLLNIYQPQRSVRPSQTL